MNHSSISIGSDLKHCIYYDAHSGRLIIRVTVLRMKIFENSFRQNRSADREYISNT